MRCRDNSSLLPRDYEIQTSIDIDAPVAKVFPHVNQLDRWQDWSPWSPKTIPDLEIEYSEQKSGKGAVQSWKDPRGEGKLWIVSADVNKQVDYKMRFANFLDGHTSFAPLEWSLSILACFATGLVFCAAWNLRARPTNRERLARGNKDEAT